MLASGNVRTDFQKTLLSFGVPIYWWADINSGDPLFSAVHLFGVRGIVSGYDDMRSGAADVLVPAGRAAIEAKLGSTLDWPSSEIGRGDAVALITSLLG